MAMPLTEYMFRPMHVPPVPPVPPVPTILMEDILPVPTILMEDILPVPTILMEDMLPVRPILMEDMMPVTRRTIGSLNYGVTCFANAGIQCLLATFLDDTPFGGLFKTGVNSPLADQLRLLHNARELYRPMPLLLKMPSRFRGFQQEDSQDFLSELLWIIHNDTRQDKAMPRPSVDLPYEEYTARLIASDTSPVLETFTFISHVVLICKRCGTRSQSIRHSNFLGLALPPRSTSAPTISELISTYSAQVTCVDGVNCRVCRRREPCTKQEILKAPPRVLIVHLHRFRPDGKNSDPVVLDNLLVFGRSYQLVGVIDHIGTSERSGHYTARIRAGRDWLVADDSYVGPTANPAATKQSSPYVLFYKTIV